MDRWIAAFGVKTHSPYAGRGFPTQAYFGDTHLHTSFRSMDPDFDPAEHAFYCARVNEIPTSRWSTYGAAR